MLSCMNKTCLHVYKTRRTLIVCLMHGTFWVGVHALMSQWTHYWYAIHPFVLQCGSKGFMLVEIEGGLTKLSRFTITSDFVTSIRTIHFTIATLKQSSYTGPVPTCVSITLSNCKRGGVIIYYHKKHLGKEHIVAVP